MTPGEQVAFAAYAFAALVTFGVMASEGPKGESWNGTALLLFLFLAPLWPLVWFISFLCWWRLKCLNPF
jgi:hypothetical protein